MAAVAASFDPVAPLSPTALALNRCLQAYQKAYAVERAKGSSAQCCHWAASPEYRRNLPYLETLDDVKSLIACVAQGVGIGAFDRGDAAQLLSAARVASAMLDRKTGKK